MPANRSRTERWRDCLQDIAARNGAIEISIDRGLVDQSQEGMVHHDLVWRVRLLGISDTHLTIERPTALNASVELAPGTRLIAAMTIGQNRWMFKTQVQQRPVGSPSFGLALRMPDTVERCSRRSFYRVTTASVDLPPVEVWPLLDPTTVVAAEVANRAQINDLTHSRSASTSRIEAPILPEVGPRFIGRLANLGGGGAGLLVEPEDASTLESSRIFWLRVDLRPELPAPLGLTARLAHSHAESTGRVYAGIAFEFGFHQGHRGFVVEQITSYVAKLAAKSQTSLRAAG